MSSFKFLKSRVTSNYMEVSKDNTSEIWFFCRHPPNAITTKLPYSSQSLNMSCCVTFQRTQKSTEVIKIHQASLLQGMVNEDSLLSVAQAAGTSGRKITHDSQRSKPQWDSLICSTVSGCALLMSQGNTDLCRNSIFYSL